LHQRQKPGFLRLLQPENLDSSLRNRAFQVLLTMVQDMSKKWGKYSTFQIHRPHRRGTIYRALQATVFHSIENRYKLSLFSVYTVHGVSIADTLLKNEEKMNQK
jgi:hypothetical protein